MLKGKDRRGGSDPSAELDFKGTRTTATLVGQKVQMSMKQFDQKIDKSDIKRHLKAVKMRLIRSSVHGSSNQMAD